MNSGELRDSPQDLRWAELLAVAVISPDLSAHGARGRAYCGNVLFGGCFAGEGEGD